MSLAGSSGSAMNPVFHIGYHKTGSSWLQQVYFREHPKIKLVADSIYPWDDPFLRSLVATSDRDFAPRECRALLERQIAAAAVGPDEVAMVSAERLSGHPFSGGYDSFRIAARIHAIMPEARIVCVVRGQAAMIESVYRQLVTEGYTGGVASLFDRRSWKSVAFDLGFYEYDRLYDAYVKLFGADRLLFAPYERMRSAPEAFLAELCRFAGVEPLEEVPTGKLVGRSLPGSAVGLMRFANRFRVTELNPFPLLRMPEALRLAIVAMLRRMPGDARQLGPAQEDFIRRRFLESNQRLGERVDVDPQAYPR